MIPLNSSSKGKRRQELMWKLLKFEDNFANWSRLGVRVATQPFPPNCRWHFLRGVVSHDRWPSLHSGRIKNTCEWRQVTSRSAQTSRARAYTICCGSHKCVQISWRKTAAQRMEEGKVLLRELIDRKYHDSGRETIVKLLIDYKCGWNFRSSRRTLRPQCDINNNILIVFTSQKGY